MPLALFVQKKKKKNSKVKLDLKGFLRCDKQRWGIACVHWREPETSRHENANELMSVERCCRVCLCDSVDRGGKEVRTYRQRNDGCLSNAIKILNAQFGRIESSVRTYPSKRLVARVLY